MSRRIKNAENHRICSHPLCDEWVGPKGGYCPPHWNEYIATKTCSWKTGCKEIVGKPGPPYCENHRLEYQAKRRAALGYTGNSRPPANTLYICAGYHELGIGEMIVKFGITNNEQRRLGQHARGSSERPFHLDWVLAVWERENPRDVENAIKARLRELGATPIIGTEYFNEQWTDAIIEVAREHGLWVNAAELGA